MLERLRSRVVTRVVVPADRAELANRGHPRDDREVALAAHLGRRRSAGIADDAKVSSLEGNERHEDENTPRPFSVKPTYEPCCTRMH
jgi:hypothetical protein